MKLWILKPKEDLSPANDQWGQWYDKAFGFVVRAHNKQKAREYASRDAGDEGEDAWLDSQYSTCEELTTDGEAEVIMRDLASA